MKERRTYLLFLAFVLSFMLVSCAPPKDQLSIFIEKFETMERVKKNYGRWQNPSSPFLPYLKKEFHEGLTADQKRLYHAVRDRLDCDMVARLEREGFLNLYPHLAPAFERENVGEVFSRILRDRSSALRYCEYRKQIKDALSFAARHKIVLPPFRAEDFFRENLYKTDPPLTRKERWILYHRCLGISRLVLLALEKQYAPALRILINWMGASDFIILSSEIEFSLYQIAEGAGLLSEAERAHSQTLREKMIVKDVGHQIKEVEYIDLKLQLSWMRSVFTYYGGCSHAFGDPPRPLE